VNEVPSAEAPLAGSVVFALMGAVETQAAEQVGSAAVVHEVARAEVRPEGSDALAELDAAEPQAAERAASARPTDSALSAESCVVVRPGARTAGSVATEGRLDVAAPQAVDWSGAGPVADVRQGVPSWQVPPEWLWPVRQGAALALSC
jgi:hypothetical protein